MTSATSPTIDPERLAKLEHLVDRFCRGIDRFDRELFLSAFHSDAISKL
jgi:hypothetical protein